jgi:voltage-gated potassium channel
MSLRRRAHELTELARPDDPVAHAANAAMLALIVLNVAAVILETVPGLGERYRTAFSAFEVVSIVVFSLEYLVRLWGAVEEPGYERPVLGRLRCALRPLTLIDLLSVLPFYLAFVGLDLRYLRALRLLRLVRIAKLTRYSRSLQLMRQVVVKRRGELLGTAALMLLLLIVSACALYAAEREAQPESFSSIPAAMWWSITTLTTVGYGDVTPVTAIGKVLAAVVAVVGIGLFALPTGVLGAGFIAELSEQNDAREPACCPHCGRDLAEPPTPAAQPEVGRERVG